MTLKIEDVIVFTFQVVAVIETITTPLMSALLAVNGQGLMGEGLEGVAFPRLRQWRPFKFSGALKTLTVAHVRIIRLGGTMTDEMAAVRSLSMVAAVVMKIVLKVNLSVRPSVGTRRIFVSCK